MVKSKYDAMLRCADQYYYVSMILQKKENECEKKEDYSFTMNTVVPRAVIAAIACEIYLKALIYCQGTAPQPKRGHNLFDLYKKLNQEDKEWCEKEFNKWIGNSDLITELREHSEIFTDFRYMYEIGWIHNDLNHVRVGTLTKFMKLLREVCQKYK